MKKDIEFSEVDLKAKSIIDEWNKLVKDDEFKNVVPMILSIDPDTLYLGAGIIREKYPILYDLCIMAYSELHDISAYACISFDFCRTSALTIDAWLYISIYVYDNNLRVSDGFENYNKKYNLKKREYLESKYGC